MPGILVGRTRHVAFGVTNGYADVQDLYIETLDAANPDRYLDGGKSVPFDVITGTIRIRDTGAPGGLSEQALKIRYTRRSPVITDHPGLCPKGDKLLVLRSMTQAHFELYVSSGHDQPRPASPRRTNNALIRAPIRESLPANCEG